MMISHSATYKNDSTELHKDSYTNAVVEAQSITEWGRHAVGFLPNI